MTTTNIAEHTVPDHVPEELVRDFNHYQPLQPVEQLFKYFSDTQKNNPDVFYSHNNGGYWVVTRTVLVREILTNPEDFSSYPASIPAHGGRPPERKLAPIELDPPIHKPFRSILAPLFKPAVMTAMEPRIREKAIELIEGFIKNGSCELVEEFAAPLPTTIFLEIMGYPLEMREQFLVWNHSLFRGESWEEKKEAGVKIHTWVLGYVTKRKAEPPRDDLLSLLINAEIEGKKIDDDMLMDACYLLFIAGLDTVIQAMSFAINYLAQHPEQRQKLKDDPSLIKSAVEEMLRVHSFVNPNRRLTRDLEFHGVKMKEGDMVLCSTAMVSLDPQYVEDFDVVRLDRKPNMHGALGAGPHTCIGAPLARREIRIALEEFLRLIPDFELTAPGLASGGGVMGMHELNLKW